MDPTKRYCKIQVRKKKVKMNKFIKKQSGMNCEESDPAKFKLDRFIEDVKKYAAKAKKDNEKETNYAERKHRNGEKNKLKVPNKKGIFENAVISKAVQARGSNPVEEGRNHVARLKGDLSSLILQRSLDDDSVPVQEEAQLAKNAKELSTDTTFEAAHSKIVDRIICVNESIDNTHLTEQNFLENNKEETKSQLSSEILQKSLTRCHNSLQKLETINEAAPPSIRDTGIESLKLKSFENQIIKTIYGCDLFDGPSRRDAIEGKTAYRPTVLTNQHQMNIQSNLPDDNKQGSTRSENRRSAYSKSAANLLIKYFKLPHFKRPLEEIILHNELCRQHIKSISHKVAETSEKRNQLSYSNVIKKLVRCFVKTRFMDSSPPPESSALGSEMTMLFGKKFSHSYRNMLNKDETMFEIPSDLMKKHSADVVNFVGDRYHQQDQVNIIQENYANTEHPQKNYLMLSPRQSFLPSNNPQNEHTELYNTHKTTNFVSQENNGRDVLIDLNETPCIRRNVPTQFLYPRVLQTSEMTQMSNNTSFQDSHKSYKMFWDKPRSLFSNHVPDIGKKNILITPMINRKGHSYNNIYSRDIFPEVSSPLRSVLNDPTPAPFFLTSPRNIISPVLCMRSPLTPPLVYPLNLSPTGCEYDPKKKLYIQTETSSPYLNSPYHLTTDSFKLKTPFKKRMSSPFVFNTNLSDDSQSLFPLNCHKPRRFGTDLYHLSDSLPSPINERCLFHKFNEPSFDDSLDSIFFSNLEKPVYQGADKKIVSPLWSKPFSPEKTFKCPQEPSTHSYHQFKRTKIVRSISSPLKTLGHPSASYTRLPYSQRIRACSAKEFVNRNRPPAQRLPLFSPHNF